MRDDEGVASSTAGDADGLAEAYDRYADSLYKYCRSLLSDPADAADAVQNTYVIAAAQTSRPGEEDLSRARLYAIARNECLRARGSGKTASPDAAGEGADAGEDGEQAGGAEGAEGPQDAGLRALIRDAIAGLTPAERELIQLHLWHGLEAAEIATVLGVSGQSAERLLSRASDQFQACLDVLLIGRADVADPAGCAQLAGILAGWDGTLTPALRWWVHGHIKQCRTCAARRAAELSPALPPGVSTAGAIAAAAQETLRQAAGPPAALRAHTLALAAGEDPSSVAHRAVLLGSVESAGRRGVPGASPRFMAGLRPGTRRSASRQLRTAAAACLLTAVVVAAVVVAMTDRTAPVKLAEGTQQVISVPTAPAASAPATRTAPAATPSHSRPAVPSRAHRPPKRPVAATPGPRPTGAGATSATPAPSPPSTGPTPPPPPTSSPPPTASPPPPPTPHPPAATLAVNPPGGNLQMSPFGGASITLTAKSGPVDWSVTASGGSGHVFIQPPNGTLQPGQSVTVFILASRHASGRQLMVSPGGTVFTIVAGGGQPSAQHLSRARPSRAQPSGMCSVAFVGWQTAFTSRSGTAGGRRRYTRPVRGTPGRSMAGRRARCLAGRCRGASREKT